MKKPANQLQGEGVAPTGIPAGRQAGNPYLKFRKLLFYPRPTESAGRALNYRANFFFKNRLPAEDLKNFSR